MVPTAHLDPRVAACGTQPPSADLRPSQLRAPGSVLARLAAMSRARAGREGPAAPWLGAESLRDAMPSSRGRFLVFHAFIPSPFLGLLCRPVLHPSS